MNTKNAIILCFFISVTFGSFLPDTVYGIDRRDTLRGLKGVMVLVESLSNTVEREGLTARQIRIDVERRLRGRGIRVLSQNKWLQTPGGPYLYINLNIAKFNGDMYLYSLKIELHQSVILERDKHITCPAVTWDQGMLGTIPVSELKTVKESILGYVDIQDKIIKKMVGIIANKSMIL